jgi:hypothetical protein
MNVKSLKFFLGFLILGIVSSQFMGGFSVAADTAIIVEEFETKFTGQEADDSPNLDVLTRQGYTNFLTKISHIVFASHHNAQRSVLELHITGPPHLL